MLQEIITYLIVAIAFFYAGYKIAMIFNKKRGKNSPQKQGNFAKGCGNCTAECILRDSCLNIPDHLPREKTKSGL